MRKIFLISLLSMVAFQAPSFASVATSDSYSLTLGIMDVGGGTSETASHNYTMLGKMRDLDVKKTSRANYRVGEGFLRSIFYSLPGAPYVTDISPNFGYNDRRVNVVISGGDFDQAGTTIVELRLLGQPVITAEVVDVADDGLTITVRFDLAGALPDPNWDLYINNNGYEILQLGVFEVREAPLKIVGDALNFPNPFNPDEKPTIIRYVLTQDANITINLYNVAGERIWSRKYSSGTNGGRVGPNDVEWIGKDVFNSRVPNGIYVCQIVGKGRTLALVKIAVLR
jgi:hypothetical protein